jgi:hypothetical protein
MGQTIAAVGLDGLIECLERGLGGGELCDVGGLTGGLTGIEEFGATGGGQSTQLYGDV